jgi:shikimate kinase
MTARARDPKTGKPGDREAGNGRLLFLVGYRGSGKTTVARLLAERLRWQWLDADDVLEATCGRTVRQVFAEEGEGGFREREAALLTELCLREQHVIATGGGVVLGPENRRRLREAGMVVWLTADAETLWRRLQQDATSPERRPALTVGGLAEIEELLRLREPYYREVAKLVVDTSRRTAPEVADFILAGLPNLR